MNIIHTVLPHKNLGEIGAGVEITNLYVASKTLCFTKATSLTTSVHSLNFVDQCFLMPEEGKEVVKRTTKHIYNPLLMREALINKRAASRFSAPPSPL